jgi:hypothetical protein
VSGPFEITGDLPVGSPVPAEHLLDVAAAYELAELARRRAAEARDLLLAAVDTARHVHFEPLQSIADHLGAGVSRQYVQKLLREAEERETALAADGQRLQRPAKRSGWKRGAPQCGGCKRFLRSGTDICPGCGYAGHGGYVGVPAATSHLDRHR